MSIPMRMGLACLSLLLGCLVLAQPGGQPPTKKLPPSVPDPAAEPPPRDPTQPSPKLKDALDLQRTLPGQPAESRLSAIRLKGRIIAKDKPPVALIELEGKPSPVLVTAGSTISLGSVQLRVVEVSAAEVRIEVQPLNETLSLR